MDVTDLVKYAMKFPPKAAVLDFFKRSDGVSKITGYDSLKTYANTLPDAGLIPGFTGWVVAGSNDNRLSNHIKALNGHFMMVEYGIIRGSGPGRGGQRGISFGATFFSAYIGSNNRGMDALEEALVMDKCLEYASLMVKQMEEDNAEICDGERFNTGSFSAAPIEPMLLYDAIGWQLSFNRNNSDFL